MKTLLIDASSILFPTLYNSTGLELTTDDGTPVTCVYIFLEELLNLSSKFNTNKVVVVFDSKGSNRREIYPEYKMNRQEVPEEIKEKRISLFNQIPILKDFLATLGISTYSFTGLEADDIIASIVYNNPLEEFITVSSDHDFLQLIRENNVIYNPKKETIVDVSAFQSKFPNLQPEDYWKILSLAGCSTDNVKPCFPGVGEKTAYKYLTGQLKETSKAYSKIKQGEHNVPLITRLVKLPFEDTPVLILSSESQPILSDFLNLCIKYQFNSFTEEHLNKWILFFNHK